MYLKNIFGHKAVQVAATVGSLAFGLYNLYIMGRVDEIEEICGIAESDKEIGPGGRVFKFARMDSRPDSFIHVEAIDKYVDELYTKLK